MLLSNPSVQIGLTDFAEDIAEPILPILEALGLLDETGQHLDLNGWNFSKAMDFAKSYERTTAILSILDMLDSTIQSFPMYRNTDGHVTAEFSPNSIEETWYKIMETPIEANGSVVETCITLHRTELDDTLSDNHHCQSLVIGVGLRVLNFRIGQTIVNLNLAISIPLFAAISESNGNVTTMVLLKKDDTSGLDAADAQQLCSVSIQASFSHHEGDFLSVNAEVGNAQCKSIDIACAISPVGSDVDLTLVEFSGSMSAEPVNLDIDLVTPSGGFMPDWNQLFQTFSASIGNDLLRQHLFPALGLLEASFEHLELPTLPVFDIIMNLDSPQFALNAIRDWIFEIVTDSENLYRWLGHIRQFFIGTATELDFPGFDRYQLDMTRDNPWRIEWMSTTNFTLYLDMWNDTSTDGIPCFNFGIFCELTKPINSIELDLGLRFHLIRFKSEGSNLFDFAPEISLEFSINPIGSEFLFNVDASNLFQPAIDGLNGQCSVGAFLMGLDFIKGTGLQPYCLLIDLNLGNQSFPEFDLLNDSLADAALEEALIQLRMIISQTFSSDPILQRLGAILGLCSPRGGTFQSNVWEDGALDLRVGGTNQGGNLVSMPTLLQYVTQPLESIGRYHRELFRISSIQGTEGTDVEGIHAWSFIAEAIQDIIHSCFQLSQGDSIIPIREWEELADGISHDVDATVHHHTLQITPIGSRVPLNLEFEYNSDDDKLTILPFIGFDDLLIGQRLEMDIGIYFVLFSCYLPPVSEANSAWALRANLDASMRRSMVDESRPPMNIISYSAISLTLQELSLGFEWERTPSTEYGYYITLEDLKCTGQLPDLSQFFLQLPSMVGPNFDFSQLNGLSWDGFSLHLPDMSFITFSGIDMGWHRRPDGNGGWLPKLSFDSIQWPFDLGGYLNLPQLPSINLKSGSSTTLFNIPNLTIRSIDFDGSWFDFSGIFQQLFPSMGGQFASWNIGNFLKLPQIKNLFGQFLTSRGGRIGFFLGGFFKIDPNFPYLNLEHFVSRGGFSLPSFDLPPWPDLWKLYHGMSENNFGLGPFSLPFDWPELDFEIFIDNPFEGLRLFFRNLFSTSSKSGEPFAFPALRWLHGLFSGSLPDLRLPDLGWGGHRQQSNRDGSWFDFDFNFDFDFDLDFDHNIRNDPNSPFNIKLPKIPWVIDGSGTYEDPWAIGLQPKGWPKFEFIFWLDPDGLPRETILEVFEQVSEDISQLLESVFNHSFDVESVESLPIDWQSSLATMLFQLKNLNPRARHSIGHMSIEQLTSLISIFDDFLNNSDGILPSTSQSNATEDWKNVPQKYTHRASRLNTLNTNSVATEISEFIASILDAQPSNFSVLFVLPSWLGESGVEFTSSLISNSLNIQHSVQHIFDFGELQNCSVTNILNCESEFGSPAAFNTLNPSINQNLLGEMKENLALQVKTAVDHICSTNNGKVFLIGVGLGGLAVRYYTEGWANIALNPSTDPNQLIPPENEVLGAVTLGTPHAKNLISYDSNGNPALIFLHVLRLIGAIQIDDEKTIAESLTTPYHDIAVGEISNIGDEFIEKVSNIILQWKLMNKNLGGQLE